MKTLRILTVGAITLAALGCTRSASTPSLQLSIPIRTRNVMTLSNDPTLVLQTVILSVSVNGATPNVTNVNYDTDPGDTVSVTPTGLPSLNSGDSVLFQAIAVSSGGATGMQVSYDEQTVTLASGPNKITLTPIPFSSVTKKSYLAGRLQLTDGTYPTGILQGFASRTNLDGTKTTPILVQETPIIGGWFQVFTLDAADASFTYSLKGSTAPLFLNLTSSASDTTVCTANLLQGNCPFIDTPTQGVARFNRPKSYSRSSKSSTGFSINGAIDYTIGFFGAARAGGTVCVPSDISESIPGLYAYADIDVAIPQKWNTPLDMEISDGAAPPTDTAFTYAGGGQAISSSQLYTNTGTGTGCTAAALSTGTSLAINHTLFTGNDDNFLTVQAPFLMRNPFSNNSPFLDTTQTGSALNVNWSEYPGAAATAFTGNVNGFTSPVQTLQVYTSGHVPTVGMLLSTTASPNFLTPGTVVTSVSGSGTYTIGLSQPTIANGLSPSMTFTPVPPYDGYKVFAAYASNNGPLPNLGTNNNGGCSTADMTSWTLVQTVPMNTTSATITAIGSTQISSLPMASTNFGVRVCAYKAGVGLIGQMASGMLQRGPTNTNGKNVFGWAHSGTPKIISTQSDYSDLGGVSMGISGIAVSAYTTDITLLSAANFGSLNVNQEVMIIMNPSPAVGCTVPAGSYDFARILNASSNLVSIPHGTIADALAGQIPSLCSAQVALVPHFSSVTLSSLLLANNYNPTTQNEGLVAFRVNGLLTANYAETTIAVAGNGFPAVTTAGVNLPTIGGSEHMSGAGGGGFGNGSESTDGLGGGLGLMSTGGGVAFLGGGGADGFESTLGGAGGGLIYVAANLAQISPGTIFTAYGTDGAANVSPAFGAGGGGGGSVNLLFNTVQSGSSYSVNANGGNATLGGGAGGGGYVNVQGCDLTGQTGYTATAAKGTDAANTNLAVDGFIAPFSTAATLQWCNN
jgi:hypothetical protein